MKKWATIWDENGRPKIDMTEDETMKLENITITATINGDPVMVVLDGNQKAMLPDLIAACGSTGKCRVAKLNPEEYTLSKPSFISKSNNPPTC